MTKNKNNNNGVYYIDGTVRQIHYLKFKMKKNFIIKIFTSQNFRDPKERIACKTKFETGATKRAQVQ
jgi:hypothetical protein